jgi:hypothetical protein
LPVVRAFNVVDEVEQIVERFAKAGTGPRKHVGQVAQAGDPFGCRSGIETRTASRASSITIARLSS